MFKHTLVGMIAVFAAFGAFARTVYDAGKALRQNITSVSPVGADGSIYTDAQGGKWQYLRANDSVATSTTSFGKSVTSGDYYRGIGGNSSAAGSPYIHVNISGAATMTSVSGGTAVEADELYVHPGDPKSVNHFVVVRFIVPEAGWYSAFVTAHDLNDGGNKDNTAGAEVRLLANNVLQARDVVVLENWIGKPYVGGLQAKRFDFQMSVRWMAANETIDFMVGANGAHNSDATGLKAFVTKEDEGSFYDSGLAMTNIIFGSKLNPFGTKDIGMWYYLYADTSDADANAPAAPSAEAFAAWAPGNLTRKLLRFAYPWDYGSFKGFVFNNGTPPLIGINKTSGYDTSYDIGPQELYTQQSTDSWTRWTTLRFRPTRSGVYTGSVVVRDVAYTNAADIVSDGIVAYLLVSEKVVTNAVVCAETRDTTVHFTLPPCLVVANEPIDIVLSPREAHNADSAAISAIFRRETDVYDLGPSMVALDWANAVFPNSPAHPFADVLGGGAKWDIGTSTATSGNPFTTMPKAFRRVVNKVDYFGFGSTYTGDTSTDGGLPRVMAAINGVANEYETNEVDKIYRLAPNELWAHPNNSDQKYAVVRAFVPSNGVYRARAYARDVTTGGDGIRFSLGVSGSILATRKVFRDSTTVAYEAALDAPRLWLKKDAAIDVVVDPDGSHNSDGTGIGFCYMKDPDVDDDTRVVNVHFTERGTGKFSPTAQLPREGWVDWSKWNAFRAGDGASAEVRNCCEADGETRRNVSVSLTRNSGSAIAKGSSSDAQFYSYITSSGADDTYTFTISNLKKNEPYTLYLYSAKSSYDLGNAKFTVGGVTKGLEETWNLGNGRSVLTRFDVASDANGVVTGVFAAADENGGAFNGFTLVGEFPNYVAPGMMLFVR